MLYIEQPNAKSVLLKTSNELDDWSVIASNRADQLTNWEDFIAALIWLKPLKDFQYKKVYGACLNVESFTFAMQKNILF